MIEGPAPPCAGCGGTSFEGGQLVSPNGLFVQPRGGGIGEKIGALFAKKNAVETLTCTACGRIALYAADRAPRA